MNSLRLFKQSFLKIQKAKMGGHGKPHVLRDINNPRKKNEWDLLHEELPAEKSDVAIANAIGAFLWFFILVSAYNDKGKAFGLYKPWLEVHDHDDHHGHNEHH